MNLIIAIAMLCNVPKVYIGYEQAQARCQNYYLKCADINQSLGSEEIFKACILKRNKELLK
jgi:hypothetical protein